MLDIGLFDAWAKQFAKLMVLWTTDNISSGPVCSFGKRLARFVIGFRVLWYVASFIQEEASAIDASENAPVTGSRLSRFFATATDVSEQYDSREWFSI